MANSKLSHLWVWIKNKVKKSLKSKKNKVCFYSVALHTILTSVDAFYYTVVVTSPNPVSNCCQTRDLLFTLLSYLPSVHPFIFLTNNVSSPTFPSTSSFAAYFNLAYFTLPLSSFTSSRSISVTVHHWIPLVFLSFSHSRCDLHCQRTATQNKYLHYHELDSWFSHDVEAR